ncbi:hypothetical protein ABBQ38_004447 [Trebouxia sp. C0009 RCD-2024]
MLDLDDFTQDCSPGNYHARFSPDQSLTRFLMPNGRWHLRVLAGAPKSMRVLCEYFCESYVLAASSNIPASLAKPYRAMRHSTPPITASKKGALFEQVSKEFNG